MLKTIIIREIQEYIKSKKFLIGMFITVVLVVITTIINIEDYVKRQQDYLDAKREMGKTNVFRPPQSLSIIAVGKDRKLGNRVEITSTSNPIMSTGYLGLNHSKHRQFISAFSGIDFLFVIRVVLSMLVIFFAYNAVSEEKAHGSLKLILSNNIPRDKVILGKSIGGLCVIGIPLIISFLLSLLIMLVHPLVSLTLSDLVLIIGIFFTSLLYLTVFYTVSLVVSVLINKPSTALMILLQIWVFIVILYPNISVFIADKSYTMMSEGELRVKKFEISNPYFKKAHNLRNEYRKKNSNMKSWDYANPLLVQSYEASNTGFRMMYKVLRDHENTLLNQAENAYKIGIFSPAVVLDRITLHFSRTDIYEFEHFLDGVSQLYHAFRKRDNTPITDIDRLENMPEFAYRSETVSKRFLNVAGDMLILFMYSIIFMTVAYTLFLKKDVR